MGRNYVPKFDKKNNSINFYARNVTDFAENLTNRYQIDLQSVLKINWVEDALHIAIDIEADNNICKLIPKAIIEDLIIFSQKTPALSEDEATTNGPTEQPAEQPISQVAAAAIASAEVMSEAIVEPVAAVASEALTLHLARVSGEWLTAAAPDAANMSKSVVVKPELAESATPTSTSGTPLSNSQHDPYDSDESDVTVVDTAAQTEGPETADTADNLRESTLGTTSNAPEPGDKIVFINITNKTGKVTIKGNFVKWFFEQEEKELDQMNEVQGINLVQPTAVPSPPRRSVRARRSIRKVGPSTPLKTKPLPNEDIRRLEQSVRSIDSDNVLMKSVLNAKIQTAIAPICQENDEHLRSFENNDVTAEGNDG